MIQNLGLSTDNFYKFLTTLSLISSIYFLSFPELFVDPHNKQTTETNLEKAAHAAEIGYLTGIVSDLTTGLPDTVLSQKVQYFYYSKNGSSDTVLYFRTAGVDSSLKNKIDSLNLTNKKLAESKFRDIALDNAQKILESNLDRRQILSWILGSLSFIIFMYSIINWHKLKDKIDK